MRMGPTKNSQVCHTTVAPLGFSIAEFLSDFFNFMIFHVLIIECFAIYSNKSKQSQQSYLYFRTLNPKSYKNWTKIEAAPALPCLVG